MRGAFDINSSADEDDDSRKESPLPHQVHTALTSPGDGLVEALRVSDIRLVRSDEDGATRLPLEIYEALTALDDGLVETLRAGDIRLVSASGSSRSRTGIVFNAGRISRCSPQLCSPPTRLSSLSGRATAVPAR